MAFVNEMLSTKEIEGINGGLAQIKTAIREKRFETNFSYDLEWIFERSDSFDKKILSTKYLQLHDPESIGDTALHIALKEHNVYKILVNKKIGLDDDSSFLYDKSGATDKTTPFAKIVKKDYRNLNVFSDPRFELPHSLICSMFNVYKKSKNVTNLSDKNGISHFHIACMVNDCEMIELYLNNGVSIDHAVNKDSPYFPGYTPLHFAVKCCSVQTAALLLKFNANVHLKDAKGMLALHLLLDTYIEFAAVSGKRVKLKSHQEEEYWSWGGSKSDTYSYMLAHDCYAEDYLKLKSDEIIRMFLKNRSEEKILFLDDMGLSHFHVACIIGDIYVSQDIADMNRCISMDSLLWPGYSPLHFAALLSDVQPITELMKKGGNMGIKNAVGISPFDICVETYELKDICKLLSSNPVWKDILFSDDKTSLLGLITAMQDDHDLKKFVNNLPQNFDIHIAYDSPLWPGFTPMHLAILFTKNINEETAEHFEQPGLIPVIFRQSLRSLYTSKLHVPIPLNYAFQLNRADAMLDLLNCYSSLKNYKDAVDDNQISCLHVACAEDHSALVKQLLSWGNHVNVVCSSKLCDSEYLGWTPLHFAVANNSPSCLELLCQNGANVLAKEANGLTSIHLSLISSSTKRETSTGQTLVHLSMLSSMAKQREFEDRKELVSSLLLSSNFQDAVADDIGLSHLHVACYYGLGAAAKKLVKNGADINKVIDYKPERPTLSSLMELDGATPLYLALQRGDEKLVKSLLKLGADVFAKSPDSKALICDFLENNCNESICNSNQLFFSMLLANEDLQKRVEEKIGMTMLHVVCRMSDATLAEDLLDKGADVNAQIHATSPIWFGYTPLHALKYSTERGPLKRKVLKIARLLLDRGADVTLAGAEGKTAVHVAYEHCSSLSEYNYYKYASMLLKAQRDFSVNPRSIDGLTHFHVACGLNDLVVVEKFLKHADVDMNQRIECFIIENCYWEKYENTAGCTPLHLALSKRTPNEIAARLEIVDLLLKRGADVHAENACGDTPLNRAVECNVNRCEQLVERLIRNGADASTTSVLGKAPLEHLILKKSEIDSITHKLTPEEVIPFLKFGFHFNDYCPSTGRGYLAIVLSRLSYEDMQYLIASVRVNYPDAMKPKYKGRTAIHNIVSGGISNIDVGEYAALIDQLSKFDCDVDDQDDEGQTALHLAVQHRNAIAVSALLLCLGAVMSIHDSYEKAAFAYNPKTCSKCYIISDDGSESDDSDESGDKITIDYGKCNHADIHRNFLVFVLKLQLWKPYEQLLDEFLGRKTYGQVDPKRHLNEDFYVQLEKLENLKIGSSTVDFGDFLSENGAVIKYSTMSACNREAIDDFFSNETHGFRNKFGLVTDVIRFQYRKAVKRWKLMEASKEVLVKLTSYRLPELCSEYILQFLNNSTLANLVAAMA